MKLFYKGFDLSVRKYPAALEKKTVRACKAVRRDDGWELTFRLSDAGTSKEMDSLKKEVELFYKCPERYDAPKANKVYSPLPARRIKKVDRNEEEE